MKNNEFKEMEDSVGTLKVILTKNKFALIDKKDYELINKIKWSSVQPFKNKFYAQGWCKKTKKIISMHKYLCNYKYTDHINGDGLDNRRCNLRESNQSLNMANSIKRKNLKSKYKGVWRQKGCNNFFSSVMKDGKKFYLGSFKTEREAGLAYDKKAIELFGGHAKINF